MSTRLRAALAALLFAAFLSPALAQQSDEATLDKTRDLYDAPFTRGLILFDCEVNFDWKEPFVTALGSFPPAAAPAVRQLQAIPHRVLVDRSGATVSAQPKEPDLTAIAHAADMEQGLKTMVKGGLDAWLPFATNVILPMGATKYQFEKIPEGYRLTMNGRGVAATLLLNSDSRLTSVVAQQPQPLRFTTDFSDGPDGYLLSSLRTASTTDPQAAGEATFVYTYQAVQSIQLPATVTVTPAKGETWHYSLSNCHLSKGTVIKLAPPPVIAPTSQH